MLLGRNLVLGGKESGQEGIEAIEISKEPSETDLKSTGEQK